MKRLLILLALLLVSAPAFAQTSVVSPSGATSFPAAYVIPASAVNGAGGIATTSLTFTTGSASTINGPTGANFNVLAATAQTLRLGNIDGVPITIGGTSVSLGTITLMYTTAPTISSGFGTSPAILSSSGTTSFRVNVGTGGAATSGVIGMPAANTGWNCQVVDLTNNTVTRETASTTTTVTVTAAAAWAASDTLIFNCSGY